MGLLRYEYLGPEVLAGFDTYKYSCRDTSPLSNYVMHPFWNQCVKVNIWLLIMIFCKLWIFGWTTAKIFFSSFVPCGLPQTYSPLLDFFVALDIGDSWQLQIMTSGKFWLIRTISDGDDDDNDQEKVDSPNIPCLALLLTMLMMRTMMMLT